MKPANKILVDLSIAAVQLNPQIGKVNETISRAKMLLNQFKAKLETRDGNKNVDMIVFPEFALTGYNFMSRDHILPYTHTTKESPSFKFAQNVSKMFNCYTIIGYPESETESKKILFNSAAVVSPQGELIFNYRKSFLYFTEDNWGCSENPKQFQNFPLIFKKKGRRVGNMNNEPIDVELNTSIGICMDLSPYKFEAPFNDCEFASFNLDKRVELIICPMAWLHSSSVTKQDYELDNDSNNDIPKKLKNIENVLESQGLPIIGSQSDFQLDLDNNNKTARIPTGSSDIGHTYNELSKPDMTNVNYWLLRFLPFLQLNVRKNWAARKSLSNIFEELNRPSYMGTSKNKYWEFANRNTIMVNANRCGVEGGDTLFAGSSGIYKFNGREDFDMEELTKDDNKRLDSTNPSVELYGNLGKGKEGIIVRDIQFEIER
ncbi:similar to Saccharomyces cerevisiae YJR062C NTA1 Amidase [Maudiozyma barnettii]|uniref:Similar to Saccharomyces cerevisiae YJR062C NTA1 Amidase n=1 Tax=Maudiozyma barnettii TaxID=61262 RepID=A0A8H2VFJ8_9SACH|nr:amidase [Kazachstania barnettii]CAB4254645.1 similar to Saccharomyces cerevisiae YJR062C NTA1 Amidase [Kazachstania barnettii]CAD1782687.1 similar to Saccharomyces cerevisiae YJR062C NTA1 Amidase [Kazachstania barnettii]